MTRLRPLERRDLPALLALQHAFTGEGVRWTLAHLDRELHDPARDGGRRVVVAERAGVVVGGAGWIVAGDEMFGAPVLAGDVEAAGALLDHLVARAHATGVATLRVSATALDAPKHQALAARGFEALFDFLTLARPPVEIDVPSLPLVHIPVTGLPTAAMRDLVNETFAGVPNAPPMDEEATRHALDALWPEGSGVWIDSGGEPAGFLWGTRERDGDLEHAAVDSIGVRAAWRGQGVGRLLLGTLLGAAARAGLPEVRALIAWVNEPSLRLHRRLGFAERSRFTVWQLAR